MLGPSRLTGNEVARELHEWCHGSIRLVRDFHLQTGVLATLRKG